MDFLKSENIICFSKKELYNLIKSSKVKRIFKEMNERGLSFNDLRKDPKKMKEIADKLGEEAAEDRDEHEVYLALFDLADFYDSNCKICFKLKNFNPNKDSIKSFKDLNKFRKQGSISDFLIKSEGNFRDFQLKRYRGEMITNEIFNFIVKKVKHYGELKETNLLVHLQPKPYTKSKIDFHKVHKKLINKDWDFDAHVLLSFNNMNKKMIIIQLYPDLKKTEKPFVLPSKNFKNF